MTTRHQELKKNLECIFDKDSTEEEIKKSLKLIHNNILNLTDFCCYFIKEIYKIDWKRYPLKVALKIIRILSELFGAFPYVIEDGITSLVKSINSLSINDQQIPIQESIINIFVLLIDMNKTLYKKFIINSSLKSLPYPTRTYEFILNYFTFLINCIYKIPEFRSDFYGVIFKGLIFIDTELPKHLIHSLELEKGFENITTVEPVVIESIKKFDNLIAFIFKFFINLNETHRSYDLLKNSFFKIVMQCRSLVATQFIFFYLCSIDDSFSNTLMNDLFDMFLNINTPLHSRHMAIIHFSGILGHGSFIKTKKLNNYITILSNWCHEYIKDKNNIEFNIVDFCHSKSGFSKFHLFFIATQSLFYPIVCHYFELKKKGKKQKIDSWRNFLSKLDLENIILSRFNPLLFCSSKIASLVSKVGIELELFCISGLISRNTATYKRMIFVDETVENEDSINILNLNNPCNFPFSSYLLPSTRELIDKIYITLN